MERGLQRPHHRSSAKGSLVKRFAKSGPRPTKEVAKGGPTTCPNVHREEVVSGGPQKRLREEVSRERRSWKEAGKEVVTGGLKGGPNEREALENKVARGGREKRSEVMRGRPQGRS